MVDYPVHVTAYGTGFEAVVEARSLDDGKEIALGGLRSGEGMGVIFEAGIVRRDG